MEDNQAISIAYMTTRTHALTQLLLIRYIVFVEQHEAALAKVVGMHAVL